MVNKLTNQEIAKVFARYWGRVYLVCHNIEKNPVYGFVNETTIGDIFPDTENKKDLLVLRLLSDITDEDAIELAELINGEKYPAGEKFKVVNDDGHIVVFSNEVIHATIKDYGFRWRTTIFSDFSVQSKKAAISNRMRIMGFEEWQFLLSKGYAVPLYFSPDHWANGMNAIELNIAINEKTLNK